MKRKKSVHENGDFYGLCVLWPTPCGRNLCLCDNRLVIEQIVFSGQDVCQWGFQGAVSGCHVLAGIENQVTVLTCNLSPTAKRIQPWWKGVDVPVEHRQERCRFSMGRLGASGIFMDCVFFSLCSATRSSNVGIGKSGYHCDKLPYTDSKKNKVPDDKIKRCRLKYISILHRDHKDRYCCSIARPWDKLINYHKKYANIKNVK